MLDIHAHILPGVDDGPGTLDEALAMARAAVEAGIRTVIATPHAFAPGLNVAPDDRDAALAALVSALQREAIGLRILPGFECRIVDGLVEILLAEPRYFLPPVEGSRLASGRHVLVELADEMPTDFMCDLLFRCQRMGIVPVLAHPERHPDVQANLQCLAEFVRKGGLLQITASALAGTCGWRQRRICRRIVKNRWVAFVASDAHDSTEITRLNDSPFGDAT